jgi:hypothetical protein
VEHVDRDDRRVLVEGLAVGLERTALIGEGRNRESGAGELATLQSRA